MTDKDLKGHIALITGASGGIGKATSLALADLGCSVAVHYHAAADKATALVEELRSKGVKAEAFQADMLKLEEVRRLHEQVVKTIGHPTILFNNAGMTGKAGIKSTAEVPSDLFEQTWRVNTLAPYTLTQLCLPHMEERQFGRIVFCSSVAGLTGGVVGPHYASSKSALHGLVHWLAQTYSKQGITVNAIAPALIEETAMLPGSNEELAKKIPVGRLGKPQEIANTFVWMVKTPYVTNKVVPVDGGLYAQ